MIRRVATLVLTWLAAAAAEPEVLRPDSLEAGRQVMRSIYGLDYAAAEAGCRRMIAANPEEPLGYALLARTYWARQLSAGQGLTIDRFAGAAFYAGTADQRVMVSPEAERSFRQTGAEASARARQKLARNPSDLGAQFTLGLVRQTLASYEFSMKGNWWAAFREGEGALTLLNRVSLAAPGFVDARLAQAVSYYVVDSLPWTVRWLPFLLRYRGGKAKAKQVLELIANRGALLADDARTILVLLHCRDGEFGPAMQQLGELGRRYPGNYLVPLELAGIELRNREPERALAIYRSMLSGLEQNNGLMKGLDRSTVLLRLGVGTRESGDLAGAMKWLEQALSSSGASEQVRVAARLELGKTADLRGQRSRAVEQYRMVAQATDFLGSRREARYLLARPYRAAH